MTKSKINWEEKKAEILSRIDIKSEMLSFGIRVSDQSPTAAGWIPAHSPYNPDKHPSCGINVGSSSLRGYFTIFNQGTSHASISFWDLAKDFSPEVSGGEFKEILYHYAKKTGVDLGAQAKKPPSMENVTFYRESLTQEVREYLHNHRGLSDASIEKYQIGWSVQRERLTYPVFTKDGELVNIRFHAWKKSQKPKTQGWTGFNQKRLWGIDRLSAAPEGSICCVTVGEWDSMLLEQETGLLSVSPTNGDAAFDTEWAEAFIGHHVVLVCDCDKSCRLAVDEKFIPAFRPLVRTGAILSFKVVWLFDDPKNKDRKDFTDFIIKAGGSGQALLEIIDQTPPKEFPLPTTNLPDAIVLSSFKEIDNPEYVGQRVSLPLYIHGENSEAYHAPTMVRVGECQGKKQSGCHGRKDWGWSCDEPIPIKTGDRIQLTCVAASDFQMKGYLREFVCDKGQKPVLILDDRDRITLREVYAHQVLAGSMETETVEKAVYTLGGKIYPIGQYQATGFIYPHPRNQRPTMLIDTMEAQEEDWQAFDLEASRPLLRQLQGLSIKELIEEFDLNVTRIHERDDLHLGVLLTLCSPLWIDFPGEGKIRGWISSVVIGDTGTGKSSVSEEIFNFARVGYRVSGMTSSRTGITYACEYDDRRGWRIKAGALLKMSGQAMIIDEAQDLAEEDLKTMAEALDRGRLKIDRIQNKEFEAETRCFFSCNPVNPQRAADQRTMSSYKYGCRSVGDIFPKMMLRRLDLILFAASYDIKDKGTVFNRRPEPGREPRITQENVRALVYFAWNLDMDQIVLTQEVSGAIRDKASLLAARFGGGEDLPIVYPEDFRKTFCRLCVACAVIDLSSEDDFETITVRQSHVDFMYNRLNKAYSAKNCQLDKHALEYEEEHSLNDEWRLAERLRDHLQGMNYGRAGRVNIIFNELLRLDPENKKEKLSQVYLRDILNVDRKTIFADIKPLITDRLVISSRGYLPTAKLFQLWHYLNDLPEDHEHYKLIDLENVDIDF